MTLPISLGILSWHGYASLRNALESYRTAGFPDLFAQRLIFFPDITDQGRELATEYGFAYSGAERNLGILGGFEGLAHSLTGDHVLLLENDLPLVENGAEAERQLRRGLDLLRAGQAKVVRYRSRRDPGEPFSGVEKYRRYYPTADLPPGKAALRRLLRPFKARRLSGTACYAEQDPHRKFPREIVDAGDGFHLVRTKAMGWTNLAILIERDFFLNVILAQVKAAKTTRTVNTFRNIEIELNSRWWRRQEWRVGVAPGLFTHSRIDDRGY